MAREGDRSLHRVSIAKISYHARQKSLNRVGDSSVKRMVRLMLLWPSRSYSSRVARPIRNIAAAAGGMQSEYPLRLQPKLLRAVERGESVPIDAGMEGRSVGVAPKPLYAIVLICGRRS